MATTGPRRPDSATSLSLLSALRDDVRQHQAWTDFVSRYGPRIESWCRRWGLQDADASDVTQNVLLQLSRQMQSFQYDSSGKFRSWLKTVTWRAWADYLKAQGRNAAKPGTAGLLEQLDTIEARDDLMQRLDDEANREILEVAIQRIRGRVNENTFEAFRLMTFEGLSGAEAAASTGMKVGSVFVAKSRVDRMLSEEVALLEQA
ncbi:MAG: sigma-70 family RNA polymerase sigma factor [Planctomycetaceae bacterium]|nr:sigma-70 family RNA polymerase sigma factor [Planctomycetaceae bacterium]